MPLPLVFSCSSESRLVLPSCFTFLVPAHPGSPEHSPWGRKTVVVVVVVVWFVWHAGTDKALQSSHSQFSS